MPVFAGVIVIDPQISAETAAALALYRKHRGDRPVVAVIPADYPAGESCYAEPGHEGRPDLCAPDYGGGRVSCRR